jgi:hypothetical protein
MVILEVDAHAVTLLSLPGLAAHCTSAMALAPFPSLGLHTLFST